MSQKLWIPGQDSRPAGNEELVLPGGKAAAPEPAAPAPSVADAAPPATAADAEAQAAQAQAQALQQFIQSLRYPPNPVQAACPQCSAQVSSLVFPVQDYGANPELLNMFLSGQLERMLCTACGHALALSFPVLVHWPQKEFLGVVVPEANAAKETPQTLIGQLTSAFMAKVPQAERKGYMLTPKQFLTLERLRDALWEFQGVTKAMRQRQQARTALLQRLLQVGDDEGALRALAQSEAAQIDRAFILQVSQMAMQTASEEEGAVALDKLLAFLMQNTAAGQAVQQQQRTAEDLATRMQQGMDMAEQARVLSRHWPQEGGREIVLSLVQALPQRFGYEFLLELSTLIELEAKADRRKALEDMRSQIDAAMKAVAQQQARLQQNAYQASVSLISGALEADDPAALLRSQLPLLRGPLMPVLMHMISQAEKNGARDVVRQLLRLRDLALQVQAETMDAEERFLFQLITAKTVGETRALMEANRARISQQLLQKMHDMAQGLQENGLENQAQKIKSLRGQLALMR